MNRKPSFWARFSSLANSTVMLLITVSQQLKYGKNNVFHQLHSALNGEKSFKFFKVCMAANTPLHVSLTWHACNGKCPAILEILSFTKKFVKISFPLLPRASLKYAGRGNASPSARAVISQKITLDLEKSWKCKINFKHVNKKLIELMYIRKVYVESYSLYGGPDRTSVWRSYVVIAFVFMIL